MFQADAEVEGRVSPKVDQLVHGGGIKALVVDIEAEDPAREVKAESSQVCLQCHRVEAWQKCASVITLQKLSESNARAVKTYY